MPKKLLVGAVVICAFAAPTLHAAPVLIAIGSLPSDIPDLSTATAGPLENGVAGNLLGGIGSGLAWAGGNTFIALPDRGPNATAYNSLVGDTTSYINRFQTVTLNLTAVPSGGLPFTLTPTLTATTLLSNLTPLIYGTGALGTGTGAGPGGVVGPLTLGSGVPALNAINNTTYFTGRSDNFGAGPSTNPNNARLDPEGVRVAKDGKSVFISDEYAPYVYQLDRATGQRIRTFTLPADPALPNNLAVAIQGPTTASEGKPTNTTGRVANKGMEGLAITPDGTTLVGIMQAPLLQDTNNNIRIVTIDIATGTTHEYAYKLTTGTGVSEIVAINNHEFLVDERDGNGLGDSATSPSAAVNKRLYKIDLSQVIGSHEVDNKSGNLSNDAFGGNPSLAKTEFLDVVAALNAAGIDSHDIPSKIEGFAFGQDVVINGQLNHTLFMANDNDFLSTFPDGVHPGEIPNTNNFYVFAVAAADMPDFLSQAFVPIPGTAWLVGCGLLSLLGFARRRLS